MDSADSATRDSPQATVQVGSAELPALGFGTWELDSATARRMVEVALELGYRHVDTAQIYQNEAAVGAALRASGVPRDEVWLTTKVWPGRYGGPSDTGGTGGTGEFADSVRRSLDRLGVETVDLLLLHWPRFEDTTLEATVERLAAARDSGWCRQVGVSNFSTHLVRRAVAASPVPLAMNQVEYHPYLGQRAVLETVRGHGMALTAYCPIAQGAVVGDRVLRQIGAAHGKNEVQVALRWLLQQPAVLAIPRTSDAEHCRQNLDVFDFELSADEMDRIFALARPGGRVVDPAGLAPVWDPA